MCGGHVLYPGPQPGASSSRVPAVTTAYSFSQLGARTHTRAHTKPHVSLALLESHVRRLSTPNFNLAGRNRRRIQRCLKPVQGEMNASDTNELVLAPCVDSVILQTWQPSIFTDNLLGTRDYFKIGRGGTFPRSLMFYSSPRAPKEIDYQSSPEETNTTN